MELKDRAGDTMGVGVYPITNCPHFQEKWADELSDMMKKHDDKFVKLECGQCQNVGENWVCLVCNSIFCSRYVKEHMVEHNQETKHSVALSFSDGSFWCYDCDYYITNARMDKLRKQFAAVKFGETEKPYQQENEKDKGLEALMDALSIENKQKEEEKKESDDEEEQQEEEKKEDEEEEDEKKFTLDKLVEGIKDGRYKKVAFLTGAGISVSAGIPDFRTPGSGLYSQLEKYNLPFPEAVFHLDFFRKNPEPFCKLAKEFLTSGCKPTLTHKFIAEFENQDILAINLSQNIDGLEIDAGVSPEKLVQAHGHFRTAHCINRKCKKEYSMKNFEDKIANDEIPECKKCKNYVKPDIVFFGEQLPDSFFKGIYELKKCDLVFVMGTSLMVQPFASLVEVVEESVPLVLMNRENPGIERENFLFLEGDLDDNSRIVMEKLGWEVPDIKKVPIKV